MPLGAFPRYVRVTVAASICPGVRGSYHEALSKNTIGRRFSANVQTLRKEASR